MENSQLQLDADGNVVAQTNPPVVEEQTNQPPPLPPSKDPVEQAANSFGLYYPLFVNIVTRLNRKSAIRLLVTLMGMPFKQPTVNLKKQDEKMALEMGMHLDQAKVIMALDVIFKHQKQMLEATNPEVAPNLETPVVGEAPEQTDSNKGE